MTTPLRNLWRKSSSLIILGRNRGATIDNGFDYKVNVIRKIRSSVHCPIPFNLILMLRGHLIYSTVYCLPCRCIHCYVMFNGFVLKKQKRFLFQVLLLKRPTKLSFPGGTVFPGGIQEKSDESDEWLTHIKNSGIEDCHLKRLINSDQNDKALIKW